MEDFYGKLDSILQAFEDNSIHITRSALSDLLDKLEQDKIPEPSFHNASEISKLVSTITDTPLEAMATLMLAAGMIRCYVNDNSPEPYNEKQDRLGCMLLAGAMFEACLIHLEIKDKEVN